MVRLRLSCHVLQNSRNDWIIGLKYNCFLPQCLNENNRRTNTICFFLKNNFSVLSCCLCIILCCLPFPFPLPYSSPRLAFSSLLSYLVGFVYCFVFSCLVLSCVVLWVRARVRVRVSGSWSLHIGQNSRCKNFKIVMVFDVGLGSGLFLVLVLVCVGLVVCRWSNASWSKSKLKQSPQKIINS